MEQTLYFPTIGINRLRMGRDGDGVTTLVAAYGCSLRCKYCLNPVCFHPQYKPKQYSPKELLEELKIDDLYFQATNGGVMFGGGEPLLYAEFIHEFRRIAPKEWRLSVESSLQVPTEAISRIVEDIDFFLVDCKDMNPTIYESYTGRDQTLLLDNLRFLQAHADLSKVTIRIPQIPSYNQVEDVQESQKKLAELGFCHFDLFTYDVVVAENKRLSLGMKKNGNESK